MGQPIPEADLNELDRIADLIAGGLSREQCKKVLALVYELGVCEGKMRALHDSLQKLL